jgi:hypothetical protein
MHALRLGLQGIELLTTGRITLPVPEPHRAYLRSIRHGQRPLAEVLDAITSAETRLTELRGSPGCRISPTGPGSMTGGLGLGHSPDSVRHVLRRSCVQDPTEVMFRDQEVCDVNADACRPPSGDRGDVIRPGPSARQERVN